MNIQQLEYIIAVEKYRYFVKASEKCYVTQPTLSMMIHKLEEELDVKIFDRSVNPVKPTAIGEKIIRQAEVIISEIGRIKEIIEQDKTELEGVFNLGVIPTIAPYLLPLFLPVFIMHFPQLELRIHEITTENIINKILNSELDGAFVSIPLNEKLLTETDLYSEKFYAYVSPLEEIFKKEVISLNDITNNRLWLLEEGHCFRNQILNFCKYKDLHKPDIFYESGSIETLMKMVEQFKGLTIIPELTFKLLRPGQKVFVKELEQPVPERVIGFVTHKNYYRERIKKAITDTVITVISQI